MSITTEHGKIIVAVLAMLTLSILYTQCSFPPRCRVRTETVLVLLLVIGGSLGIEQLNLFNGGHD